MPRLEYRWWLFAICPVLGAALASGGDYVHVVGGDTIRLRVDAAHVAIHAPDGALPAKGLESIEARAAPGWHVARVASVSRSPDGLAAFARAAGSASRFVSPRLIDPKGGEAFVTRDLVVRFDASVPAAEAEALLAVVAGGELLDRDWSGMSGVYRWRCATGSGFEVLAAAEALRALDEVRWVEPDFMLTGEYFASPNDPGFALNWGLHNIGQSGGQAGIDLDALEAWGLTRGDPAVIVVVFDGGVDPSHADLNLTAGMDFTGGTSGGAPGNNCDVHGTAVAGCISAIANNGIGTVGVAPECVVASARVAVSNVPCDGFFASQSSWYIAGLDWAHSTGARVTNSSLAINFPTNALKMKFQSTKDAGVVHFAAAGNSGGPPLASPADFVAVNAVSAIDRVGTIADFLGGCLNWNASSSFGPGLAFCAPGEDVYTTDGPGALGFVAGDYVCIDGSSFAAPMAAGVAALVVAAAPSLDASQVESILQATAQDRGAAGYDETYGHGLLKAFAAVRAAIEAARTKLSVNGPTHVLVGVTGGGPPPADATWTLEHTGNVQIDLPWTAEVVDAPAWVSLTASSGTLTSTLPAATLGVSLSTQALASGVHEATVIVRNGADPSDVHVLPIAVSVDTAVVDLGDTVNGTIAAADDADAAVFAGLEGTTVLLKLSPTTGGLKTRVSLFGPTGAIQKTITFKSKKKAQKKTLKLKASGLYRLVVEGVDGTLGDYVLLLQRKKLPGDAASKVFKNVTVKAGQSEATVAFTALPDAFASLVVPIEDVSVGDLTFAFETPSGAIVAANPAPAYLPNALTLAKTGLGEAGDHRLQIGGLATGEKIKLTLSLVQPPAGNASVTID